MNPITGSGFEGVTIQLQKVGKGLPAGYETVKETTTDATGYFEMDHLGGTSGYLILPQTTTEMYRVGWYVDGEYKENTQLSVTKGEKMNVVYHAVPYGKYNAHVENVNCSGPSDSMQLRKKYEFNDHGQYWSPYRVGCYNSTSTEPLSLPMGYYYFETKVTRSGVTTYVYDTLFVDESGNSFLEILY
jgi:hypothetical protein